MKILMTGASGMIGREIGKDLVKAGHQVIVITRDAKKDQLLLPFPADFVEGDLNKGPIQNSQLLLADGLIHLAGENIGQGRWTEKRKKSIYDSRVKLTENLFKSLKESQNLKAVVGASAVGYYGPQQDQVLVESSPQGSDFLAKVCVDWEKSFEAGAKTVASKPRWVCLRTGVVLSAHSGAMEKMILPFRFGFGSVLGSGKQWMSWIHIEDIKRLYIEAVTKDSYQGAYNAVAPDPVTNREFTKTLAKVLHKAVGPAVPAPVLKIALGEMATIVLDGQKVSCQKILEQGFRPAFETLAQALNDVCRDVENGDLVLKAEQYFPMKRDQVFPFFSEAGNLEKITPGSMQFKIVRQSTAKIEKGTLIDYELKIHGVPAKWQTLIADWQPGHKFVDEQLKGPYTKWHHTHEFEDMGPGTLMTDTVRYRLPLGLLGFVTAGNFVQGDVKKIFEYRRKVVPEIIKDLSKN